MVSPVLHLFGFRLKTMFMRVKYAGMFMNDDMKMVNLTYFAEQISKVHIMVVLLWLYIESHSYKMRKI